MDGTHNGTLKLEPINHGTDGTQIGTHRPRCPESSGGCQRRWLQAAGAPSVAVDVVAAVAWTGLDHHYH